MLGERSISQHLWNMNWFFIILLYCATQVLCATVFQRGKPIKNVQSEVTRKEPRTDVLASVREYPSMLHKCTASFIAPDLLLTTARCLFCVEDCKLFIHALSDHLTDHNKNTSGVSYDIKYTEIHPEYERHPQRNDIGLIKLQQSVREAKVFHLPDNFFDTRGLQVESYTWRFTDHLKDYHLQVKRGRTMSNAICSLALNQYIDCQLICARRQEPVAFGPFDQGSPLIAQLNEKHVIVGIYVREGLTHEKKIEVYQSVVPFYDWIRQVDSRNHSKVTYHSVVSGKGAQTDLPPTNPAHADDTMPDNHTIVRETVPFANNRANASSDSHAIPDFPTTALSPAELSKINIVPFDITSSDKSPHINDNMGSADEEPSRERKENPIPKYGDKKNLHPTKWTAEFPYQPTKKAIIQPKKLQV